MSAVTSAPCWAAKPRSNGDWLSTSMPTASTEAAVQASTTRPITTACSRRPPRPPRAALMIAFTAAPPSPSGATRPSSIETTRCAYLAARSGLCVTRISVCPDAFRSSSSSPISSPVAVSTAPVGSSASSTAGRFTSARAMATRCRSPPDSLAG